MGVAVLMGILQGIPDGHGFWMQMEAALALAHCIKKVGIALEEDAGAASYHFPLVCGNEDFAVRISCKMHEKLLGWDKSSQLEPIEILEHPVEEGNVLSRCGFVAFHSLCRHALYYVCHLGRESAFRCLAVERMVYFLPGDREVAQSAEEAIAEHFLLHVRKFDVEAEAVAKLQGDGFQQQWKEGFCLRLVRIASFPMRMRVRI